MWACPLLIYAAARSFGLGAAASLLAAAMASTLWFFDSHIHWLWFIGMISWAGASCLALLTLGLFYRLLNGQLALTAGCAVSLGLGLSIHPYTFFVLALPMAALYLRAARRLGRRGHLAVGAVIASALVMNLYWLHNAALHWHYILNSAFYAQAEPRYFVCDVLDVLCSGADTGVIGTRTGFRFLYLALGLVGLGVWREQRDSRFMPLLVGIATLYGWAYLGGYVPGMQQTQPYRQITPASLMTTLPAAALFEWAWRQRIFAGLPRLGRAFLVALGFALTQQLLAGQVLYFVPRLIAEPRPLLDGSRSPLSKYGHFWHLDVPSHVHYGVPHEPFIEAGIKDTLAWLTARLAPHTRVLVEGGVLGERLAWQGRFEVLGGFFERNMAHVDANFFREYHNYMARKNELEHYLRTFAVEWVVGNRPEFAKAPELLTHVDTIRGRRVYRSRLPIDRVLQGGGSAWASDNRIAVRGSAPDQRLLLSYHWHEALRCKPNCRVEREHVDIDRIGFIGIPAPHPADLVIWNSYQMR